MKNYSLIIGVDISKSKLDIIGIDSNSKLLLSHKILENKKPKIKSLLVKIAKQFEKNSILVVFENTGIYGAILITILDELKIDYSELSALEVYRSSGIKRGKSDKSDALVIAKYAITNKFKIKLSSPDKQYISKLKLLYTQREKIVKAIKLFESNKENKNFITNSMLKDIVKSNKSIIANLKKNLKVVNSQIIEIINGEHALKTNHKLIQSIPGVGPQTATYLLIVTKNFTCFKDARKLACYSGVAPFPYQSGSSIRGRNKVSHLADKKLKSLLNMCALSTKKHDYEIKNYYEKKVEEGKNKMLVLNNVRNKLLTRIFAVIKRQQPYININKFAA